MRSFKAGLVPAPNHSIDLNRILSLAPLDVEIGAGQGLHAIRYCQQNPHRTLLAVERTHNRFAQLEQRHRAHPHLSNLYPVHADALSVFAHTLPDHSVDRIFLLYPNPYPKSKQANLRWHNMPFMALLKKRLKPGGELTLATNILDYAQEAERVMASNWQFALREKSVVNSGLTPRTHFEKKYLERGMTCWNLLFVRGT